MPKIWPFTRDAVRLRALRYEYERAGISVSGEPIPWTADMVRVEADLSLPRGASLRKDDFTLRLPGRAPATPDLLRSDLGQVVFRLPPPGVTAEAALHYRGARLGQVVLPYLSREDFLKDVWLLWPTTFVHLGMETVSAWTFVARQCRGLHESAIVESRHMLVPLLDERLEVEFRCHRTGATVTVPACLSIGQLRGRRALVSAVPPRLSRRPGRWQVIWRVGDRMLLTHRMLRGISLKKFHQSLQFSDAGFVVREADGSLKPVTQAPALSPGLGFGPRLLLGSDHLGMVGLCRVEVRGLLPKGERGPVLMEQEVLLAGGPALVTPGTVDAGELSSVTAFEVSVAGRVLGVVPLRPAPAATFTSEGTYQPPPEYAWGVAAEEEMTERLNRLMDGAP